MFQQSAKVYDALYSFVDYEAEAALLRDLIAEHGQGTARTLLDVACGTGQHLALLSGDFQVEGLDLRPEMLDFARQRNPSVKFTQGDMCNFDLERTFDVVLCMFSSIGFVRTVENLNRCAAVFARHLNSGGVIIVEPWVQSDAFIDGHLGSLFVDEPELKVARLDTTRREGTISHLHFEFLIGTPGSIEHFTEDHELGLFTKEEYLAAFENAGLNATFLSKGPKSRELYDRGLLLATKPAT